MSSGSTITSVGSVTGWLTLTVVPWGAGEVRRVEGPGDGLGWGSSARTAAPTTTDGVGHGPVEPTTVPVRDVSALVAELKVSSGLTADQLGRLLGVSRRTIHNWAAGAAITPAREERVRTLNELVFSLPGNDPDERRTLLLDSSAGPSLFRQFAEAGTPKERIMYPVPVEEQLGL